MPRRTGSSQRWRQRQERDIYVEQANRAGWRSRAVFKLEQIQAKERLLEAGTRLRGSRRRRPGAGASSRRGSSARPAASSPSICCRWSRSPASISSRAISRRRRRSRRCASSSGDKPVDLVMSDMAPNISGNRAMDQPRTMALLDEASSFAREVLRPGGDFLVKAFQGEGIDVFHARAQGALQDRENDQAEGVAGREPRDLFAG